MESGLIDRRSFIKVLGLGVLNVRGALAAPAGFPLGIGTYTFRGVTVDQMIADLKALNISQIELSSPDYMIPGVKLPAMQDLRSKLTGAGIVAASYFCGTIANEADVNQTVEAARALGVRHVSGWAWGDALKMIDSRFSREGMEFGIHDENCAGPSNCSPDNLLEALSGLSKTIGITLDSGHMATCGHDPVEALMKLRQRVQLVHLKDVKRAGSDENAILGTGIARIPAFVAALKRLNFRHLVAIEDEASPQSPEANVEKDVAFARKVMA
jgi:sugar phosphate isomerase/epimerase